ncbi:MAG: glycosyltransferase family 2 protein [Lachnospiraceae bacterium]|nr:glycosyltransferase family 2 protein [Lachnospiraceae bacterium]
MKLISFVIPCYRSELTIERVVNEINETMETMEGYSHEIILVNDCSPDRTIAVIKELVRNSKNITGIDFAKNFGQHSALMAGLRETKGDYVICLDDDGQTPANEVGKLIGALDEGADAVYARYAHKKHSLFRNFGTFMNEKMAQHLLGKPKDLFVSSYFGVKRFVVEDMIKYENAYPYVIGLVLRATRKIVNVDVNHRSREIGSSGYTFSKLMNLWINGFTAFSVKPLRIATCMGMFFAFAGFLYGLYTIIKYFIIDVPIGFSSLMSVMVFMGGIVMLILGMIGEYIGRMYISMNNSPQYVIREKIEAEEKTE